MPSFSSFLKRKESSQIEEEERKDIGSNVEHDGKSGKLRRRSTTREFLRNLLKKSSTRSDSNRQSGQFVATPVTEVQPPTAPSKPTSPTPDPNKPLPPKPSSEPEPEPAARPLKKLDRIITPLALPDLHKLFSGAPQFFVRSEGHHTGAPHPVVAFPWNTELEIRDLSDHQQIHDQAWSSVSAWPHISRDIGRDPDAVEEHKEKQRAHYLIRCRERPNMLSMQGLERGTMGYQAALEMGVADALQVPEESSVDGGANALADRRRNFLQAKDGVRPLTESTLVELLTSASTTYHEDPAKHERPTIELYTELFTRVLFPPSRVTDPDDPYSLPVQIEALIDVLGSPKIWFDFSFVEWRIRLGQILWGPPPEDEIFVNNEVANVLSDQKYWLMLQVLLSCELLMRLDAVSAGIDHGAEVPKHSDLHRFDKKTTSSVRWSLILARHWLENIKIETTKSDTAFGRKEPTGWLAGFKSSPSTKQNEIGDKVHGLQFYGRHQARQLSGLLHFARKLNWPNVESIASRISSNGVKILESATPAVGTPRSVATQNSRNSYFTSRPNMRTAMSKQRMSAMIHPQGWLSNSYISGLVLPGEGMSHFLISTLLENDEVAVERLGQEANLYGGFLYENRSFWSTSCIVGRVLAGGKGSTECMGWVSSDVFPKGSGESWVNIEVDSALQVEGDKAVKARIWHTAVERDAHVVAGAESSSVLPGDFVIPSDESIQRPLLIKLESLDLFAATDSGHITPTKDSPTPLTEISDSPVIRTYSASMRFSLDVDGDEKKELNLDLSNDVYFVTAHPCVSSTHLDVLESPASPSFPDPGSSKPLAGHPLHKAFTFTKLSLSSVLTLPSTIPFNSLLSFTPSPSGDNAQSSAHTTNSQIPKVLIIDCTDSTTTASPTGPMPSPHSSAGPKGRVYGSDSDLLARALCAERGWNAIISRRGRVCLSCSIREASALGWRVILRYA